MKNILVKTMSALILALAAAVSFAETEGWKSYLLDDGKLSVRTNISERLDAEGKKAVWIEYEAAMTEDVDFARCLALFKDIPGEKKWLNAAASEIIETLSPGEWLAYYRYDAVWPIPSTDCVARVKLAMDPDGKGASFSILASPEVYESKKIPRFTTFDMRFAVKDLGGGKTEIRTTATIVPVIKAPLPLVKSGYPGAAADILRKIAKLARQGGS